MRLSATLGLLLLGTQTQAFATDWFSDECSIAQLAGRWVYATGVGEARPPTQPGAVLSLTSVGTLNIRRNGDFSGTFNTTVGGVRHQTAVTYSGVATVNADCTATFSFTTATGQSRVDSVVIVSRYELWGMSNDPATLWTYQARRLAGRAGYDVN